MKEFELNKKGKLIKYNEIKGKTDVVIPDDVKIIGLSAFSNCTSLTNITIPDSINQIGGYAFYNCTGLTSITIPKNVAEINYLTFGNCINLINVQTSEQIFNKINYEEQYLFTSNFARQYYTNNIYNDNDINRYKHFIIIAKKQLLLKLNEILKIKKYCIEAEGKELIEKFLKCYILPIIQNKELLYFMCNNMNNAFTTKEVDELIKLSIEMGEIETTGFLLDYKNNHFGFQKSFR